VDVIEAADGGVVLGTHKCERHLHVQQVVIHVAAFGPIPARPPRLFQLFNGECQGIRIGVPLVWNSSALEDGTTIPTLRRISSAMTKCSRTLSAAAMSLSTLLAASTTSSGVFGAEEFEGVATSCEKSRANGIPWRNILGTSGALGFA